MSDVGVLASTGEMFKTGAISIGTSSVGKFALWAFVGLTIAIVLGVIIKMLYDKKHQWTHKLAYRRVLDTGYLSKIEYINMRRFPLIKRAEVFELEKPLLGGYLISELDSYTGNNEFSIILDQANRIWKNQGDKFDPDNSCVNVSAKHAEIDLARAELKAKYQNINKTTKRVEWAEIAKFAMYGLLILAIMIVSIKGIGAWADSQEEKAQAEQAFATAMQNLAEAMETSQATANTQIIIMDMLKEIKGTNNIQSTIRELNDG